ncbi:MAG TPA: F0F1 ATP synthase subunit epsilon [Beijerinckiaceae bacterium]|nr:F0F1 ATP synthase subunit epsilon [Beijerinckiaceae bacterium]
MASFNFELVSPERILFSGPVDQVVVPGEDGDMTILANHAPVMTTLRSGIVAVSADKGAARRLYVRGGFADVTASGLTILAEVAIPVEEISLDKLAGDMKNAEDDLRDAKTDETRKAAEMRLAGLRAMQAALRN